MRRSLCASLPVLLIAASGCESLESPRSILGLSDSEITEAAAQAQADAIPLEVRYQRIRDVIGTEMYGEGGLEVLTVAMNALRDKHASGEAQLVGLEDLWTHSLQEGAVLFNQPDRLWARTTAEETGDMIGQTTVGPWQMTIANIHSVYGPRYGVQANWTNAQINDFCREHPEVQAMMISDYIQLSYEMFGRRSPYAIQRYFWLEPFVRGEIGQSEDWTASVVAHPPEGGTWEDITDEMKRNTGFYGKQILLGHGNQPRGLLYWLLVTGDEEGARDALRTWRDQHRVVAEDTPDPGRRGIVLENVQYVETPENGGFAIRPEDVRFPDDDLAVRDRIRALVEEVAGE